MKKYIVLSVNWNPDYLFYTPLVYACWNHFGWQPIVFYNGPKTKAYELIEETFPINFIHINDIPGYRSDTITQVSRLYAGCVIGDDDYLMTGDIDMIPLSDYWHPDFKRITIYGHDLTGFGHYPICYIGMTRYHWRQSMSLNTYNYNELIKRDLELSPQAKNPDFYKYWFTDQDIITERIKKYGIDKCDFVNRGQYSNGYARGRVDRGAWSLNHDQFIDCHMLRDIYKKPENLSRTMELLKKIWPGEDFSWFEKYVEDFKKVA